MGIQDFFCFGIRIQFEFTGQSLVCFTFHYLHLFGSFAFLSFQYSGICISCLCYFFLKKNPPVAIVDMAIPHASVLISDGHEVIFPPSLQSCIILVHLLTPSGDNQWEMPFFKVAVIHPGQGLVFSCINDSDYKKKSTFAGYRTVDTLFFIAKFYVEDEKAYALY